MSSSLLSHVCWKTSPCGRKWDIGSGSAGTRPGSDGVGTESDSVDIESVSVGHRISMSVVQGQAIWPQGQV
jgi:hypothetical protein